MEDNKKVWEVTFEAVECDEKNNDWAGIQFTEDELVPFGE